MGVKGGQTQVALCVRCLRNKSRHLQSGVGSGALSSTVLISKDIRLEDENIIAIENVRYV
jgi:hypothetical protein